MVVAKREPQNAGIPLQPVAEELQRTAEKGGYGVVRPTRLYRDCDLADTGMTQLAPASPAVQRPSTLKKVLVVGTNTEDAWAVALEALAANKGLLEVAAIVNVGRPGPSKHGGGRPGLVLVCKPPPPGFERSWCRDSSGSRAAPLPPPQPAPTTSSPPHPAPPPPTREHNQVYLNRPLGHAALHAIT